MKKLKSINPFTQQIIKEFEGETKETIQKKFLSLDEAFQKWSDLSFKNRAQLLLSLKDTLLKNKDHLARTATLEMGKPYKQAQAEIEKCALTCQYYADLVLNPSSDEQMMFNLFQDTFQKSASSKNTFVKTEPLGCILAIMPWNFPFWQVLRFAIPTLLMGNVVALKHASNVMGCAELLENLFLEAGFPKNIFKTFFVASDEVKFLIESKTIKAISLTGSTEAGKSVAELAGLNLKKCVLELGGSDPYIVHSSADLDLAAQILFQSRTQNNGQSCIAAKRFIIFEDVYDLFKSKLVSYSKSVKYSDPMDLETDMGPLARLDLKLELHDQVKNAVEKDNAKIFFQGPLNLNDAFYPVTILENLDPKSKAAQQEFFGPVFLLFKVKNLDDAIEIANSTSFGLGSGVFCDGRNFDVIEKSFKQLQAGSVFINSMVKSDPKWPFGGIKDSGYGRELSQFGLLEFVNLKTVSIDFRR